MFPTLYENLLVTTSSDRWRDEEASHVERMYEEFFGGANYGRIQA
jgi:hypothetical protein